MEVDCFTLFIWVSVLQMLHISSVVTVFAVFSVVNVFVSIFCHNLALTLPQTEASLYMFSLLFQIFCETSTATTTRLLSTPPPTTVTVKPLFSLHIYSNEGNMPCNFISVTKYTDLSWGHSSKWWGIKYQLLTSYRDKVLTKCGLYRPWKTESVEKVHACKSHVIFVWR